jgi:hypothetical protein
MRLCELAGNTRNRRQVAAVLGKLPVTERVWPDFPIISRRVASGQGSHPVTRMRSRYGTPKPAAALCAAQISDELLWILDF